MDIFLLLFAIGVIGIVSMTLLTFGKGLGHHARLTGHSNTGAHQLGHGHTLVQHQHGNLHPQTTKSGVNHTASNAVHPAVVPTIVHGHTAFDYIKIWLPTSPVDLFVYCLGAGATGLITRSLVPHGFLIFWVIIGALVVKGLIFKPLSDFILKFESEPSEGLEGTVAHEADVISSFDYEGRGLIRLTLDGQIVNLLASLDKTELDQGIKVVKGEKVVVIEVDPKRNICVVSRQLAGD